MDATPLQGGFADAPVQAARAFRVAMESMARPGRIGRVSGARPPAPLSPAAGTLLLTLCDADTRLHLGAAIGTQAVRDWISFHTGAPLASAREADIALGGWEDLQPLDRFPLGTPEYPDRSATLIVEVARLVSEGATLTGPGIAARAALSLPAPAAAFRAHGAAYPLGLDFFLTCDDRIAAIPRTTKLEDR